MQLRSSRRLASPPSEPQGGVHRSGRPGGDSGDDEDRISVLPEELLLHVLGRLGSAREAARTSVLSRRWRGLWAELRELTFHRVGAHALEIALAQVRRRLHRLEIRALEDEGEYFTGAEIFSVLHAADRLAPAELVLRIDMCFDFFELPCFGRATSITLYLPNAPTFVLPPAGEFSSLEQLEMKLDFVHFSELIPRCPRLRKLNVSLQCLQSNTVAVAVESKSLEELCLHFTLFSEGVNVVIVAPELKKFRFLSRVCEKGTISLSAPKLEEFLLHYTAGSHHVGYGNMWFLGSLRMERNRHKQLSLSLLIRSAYPHGIASERTFAQQVARLPVNHFSVLELLIPAEGHVFAPLLLHLLMIRTSIQRLKLVVAVDTWYQFQKCSENCDCDQDGSWRNERISLPNLEVVEIEGFSAAGHEVDFLELVFGSAPMLKIIDVKLSAEVSPSDGGYQKLRDIFLTHASVECNIYDRSGDIISFP